MASPQGGIQAATGPPRSTQSRFRFLQLPAPASPAMLHRTRREGLEGKFCSTDVVQPTRTCTMKNYVLPALGLLALAPTTALAKDEPAKRFEHEGAPYTYTVPKVTHTRVIHSALEPTVSQLPPPLANHPRPP